MDFALDETQRHVEESVRRLCARFDDAYWSDLDARHEFPSAFRDAVVAGGWLGIAMPEAYGGSGLGILEAALLMHEVARSPGAMAAASAIHLNVFGPHPIVVHGREEQKRRWLPELIAGRDVACFGVTEPDAGLDTTRLRTRARREGPVYVVDGRKVWTSNAQRANRILLLARTADPGEGERPADGLSLFYTALDRTRVEVREIHKLGRHAVDANQLFIDGLRVPAADRIGEEGRGFRYLLDGLNPERILVAAEAVGIGRQAVERAARHAGERVVFGRPIGRNQAVQHPLAHCFAELEAAWLACLHAAWAYDRGQECGVHANAAKYLAAEAAFRACERALLVHGGMGYAREFQVERLLREVLIPRLAPVSQELALCYIAERALGLPKSY